MTRGRKILVVAGVLAVIVAGAVGYLLTNLDAIIKSAIAKYGSQVTRTAVRASSVKIQLASGKGAIGGLTVANPPGFATPYAVRLGVISTRINAKTVTANPVVIDEIRIAAPQIVYEMNQAGMANIDVLKKNIQAATAAKPQKAPAKKKGNEKETRFLIRRIVIEQGRIEVRIAALGGKPQSATLKRLELNNIGSGGGATPAQVAEQVLTPIVEEVGRTVAERYLQKGIDSAVKRLLKQ